MASSSFDRWIPWTFAGGLAVVVAANGTLAYFAIVSSTGLVTERPFEAGNGYNRVLAAAAAQDALGWHASLRFTPSGHKRGEIAAEFTDAAGQPLNGLSVNAQIVRPVEPVPAQNLALPEIALGRYAAPAELDRPGQWEIRIDARRGGDLYEFAQRIFVK
jgi:nitrogen fixation protein FixH